MDYYYPHFTNYEKGSDRLNNLSSKVTQLVNVEVGFQKVCSYL